MEEEGCGEGEGEETVRSNASGDDGQSPRSLLKTSMWAAGGLKGALDGGLKFEI